jgi:hypothetical protein
MREADPAPLFMLKVMLLTGLQKMDAHLDRSAAQKNSPGQTGATAKTILDGQATFATVKNMYITKSGQNQRNRQGAHERPVARVNAGRPGCLEP